MESNPAQDQLTKPKVKAIHIFMNSFFALLNIK